MSEEIEEIVEPENEDVVVEADNSVVIVAPTEDETPPESVKTIDALVNTIAALNDSIVAMRLEIQGERSGVAEQIGKLESKIDELVNVPHETSGDEDSLLDEVKDVSNKPVSRWL